jgi:hypothetical protein
MDRHSIDENQTVARYLAGQLNSAETAAFEKYYAQHPEVVRDIEHTLRLKEGLAILSERGELDALLKQRRPVWQPALALAAGLAVLVVGVLLWVSQAAVGPIGATIAALGERDGQPLRVASTYVLARTRGPTTDMTIELPREGGALELRMIPSSRPTNGAFRVTLAQLDAANATAPLGTVSATVSSDDGFVTAYLDSGKLGRGRYVVELLPERPESPGTPADRFILDVQ